MALSPCNLFYKYNTAARKFVTCGCGNGHFFTRNAFSQLVQVSVLSRFKLRISVFTSLGQRQLGKRSVTKHIKIPESFVIMAHNYKSSEVYN